MRRTPQRERIDLGVYPQGLFLLLRNPVIILGPLATGVISAALTTVTTGYQDPIGITGLISRILDAFGMAMATIVADMVWRRGRTSFDEAWEQTRLKAGDIVYASLGLSMVVFVAAYIGGIIATTLAIALGLVAVTVFIYAIAACTIGGVPGVMSLQASLDLTKARPVNTVLLALVCLAVYLYLGFVVPAMFLGEYGATSIVLAAVCRAIAIAYAGTVIAKRYTDASISNL